MNVEYLEVDSSVLGASVLSIEDFDPTVDFTAFENEYIERFRPIYVSCRIPLDRVTDTHVLERHQFNLIECQIRSAVTLRKPYPVKAFRYRFEQVTTEEHLQDVLEIAGKTFIHDRFTIDQSLGRDASGKRYQRYVRKSFDSPDEAVYRLIAEEDGRVVAFKTHRYLNEQEVRLLLGGVHPELKNLGLGPINGFFELNELIRKGYKKAITNISVANHPVMNLELGKLGFRAFAAFAVFRRIYA